MRESPGRDLQRILDEKINPWGIIVQSVEIGDVRIPRATWGVFTVYQKRRTGVEQVAISS
jgi:regulator of protease activity HflC (stomatin/prohibitin superfamily)